MELLIFLVERRGELVSREEIAARLWGKDVFLDVDRSINTAVNKVRVALRDDPEKPRFVETVVGKGYRFAAPVICPNGNSIPQEQSIPPPEQVPSVPAVPSTKKRAVPIRLRVLLGGVAVLALVVLVALGAYLQRVRSQSRSQTPGRRLMLAVLPFENLTGDANQEYFSDGLTEEMISQLGRLDPQRMGVIGRTSVMHYKHRSEALDQIGRELGVQYVLEGSVRREADRVRITAQLIQVKDQSHLWAQEYDRQLKDLLILQGEIARNISDEIQAALGDHKTLAPPPQTPLASQTYEVYELYLKGQYFLNKRTVDGFERAIDCFQQAIAKDPKYARAYAGLADSYTLLGGYSVAPQTEFIKKARFAALRALELDERLPEAHTALALIVQNYDWDWPRAGKEYRLAIELNPNYATAHHWYAEHLAFLGHFGEALRESERARQLDPMSVIIAADNGVILFYSRQYDRAIAQFHAVQEMDPNLARTTMIRQAYAQKGMFAEVLAEDEKWRSRYGDAFWIWSDLAYVYGRTGRQAQAMDALAKVEEWHRRHPMDAAMLVAPYIGMGDKENALIWLEKAYAQHSNAMATLKVDPLYDPLRSDPRFQDLLRRVRLAQ